MALKAYERPVEKAVKCACGRVQEWVVNRDGRLFVKGPAQVQLIGFVCEECGKIMHWGVRKK